jgi:two-component system OmpR family sensor kinase
VGLGLGALAAAYLLNGVPPWVGTVGIAGFEVGRIVGLAAVLAGLVGLFHEGRRRRSERERELLAEVARARRSRRAQAERDHELRNSISGLSLLVPLLGAPTASAHDPSVISSAATSELTRMEELLDRGVTPGAAGVVDVAPVVRRAVLAQSALGAVTFDIPDDLATYASESTVTLVMTNLLANCARHAAGSAVHISGRRCRDRAIIEVSDGGPVVGGPNPPVPPAHGRGIGLSVSRRLLEAEGASLETVMKEAEPGHTVIVDLPAVT